MLPFLPPQNVLKKRDQVQAEYEAKLEAVALRKEDRPKVREGPLGGRALGAAVTPPEPRGSCPETRTTQVLRAGRAVLTPVPVLFPLSLIPGSS